MITQNLGGIKAQEYTSSQPLNNIQGKSEIAGEKGSQTKFEDILAESHNIKKQQDEEYKRKNGITDKELRIGETKNDRQFKETLEKITGKSQDKLKNKMDQDDYLNLMVTQLKHQDPTKPMENFEMATQLAQFNTVEQLLSMNKLLQKMSESKGQVESHLPYLGKEVVLDAKIVPLSKENASFGFHIPENAQNVTAFIKDAQGQVVDTLALGARTSGENIYEVKDFQKIKGPGHTVDIQAFSLDGKSIPVKMRILDEITGVNQLDKGGKLMGNKGEIDIKNIVSLKNKEIKK